MKRLAVICAALLIAGTAGGLLVLTFYRNNSTLFPALPSPNGYDDFLAAGSLLSHQVGDAYQMDVEALRELIATNQASPRLFHLGLARTSSVHTAEFITNNAGLSTDLTATKRLAQFATAIGRLAELEGRTNDAVTAYLAGMRYGNEISHGGLVIHRLVGVACEAIARRHLKPVTTNLSVADTQEIIRALEKLETETVPYTEIEGNERLYMRQAAKNFSNPIDLVKVWWSARSMLKQAKVKHLDAVARRRLLIVELALRNYTTTHNRPPQLLVELTPDYVARVPLDPFTRQALGYRPTGTNWLLYSVGADRADDGGQPRSDLRSDID